MPSYRLLHCADLHLDSPLRGLESDPDAPSARIRGATRQALINLVDFALDQQVAVVLIAGDLYDGDWQDWRTGQFLVRQLERLTRAGIAVVAISGNHDAESIISRKLSWPLGARLLPTARADTATFPHLALSVHGRGFAQREVLENLLPSYPAPVEGHLNIGLLHTAATGRPGHAAYAPCTIEQLAARGYDYWALGHIHTREVLCADPWIVFPGNLQGRHVRECGCKGATLITVTEGRITGVDHHALDVVRWADLRLDLTAAADEEAAMAMIRQSLAEATAEAGDRLLAARLHLHGATAAHIALTRDPGASRDRIYGEALSAGAGGALWLEQLTVATAPLAPPAPRDDMAALLLDRIQSSDPATLAAGLKPFAQTMLERAGGLAAQLGETHPLVLAAEGQLDLALLHQARALLLAQLDF